MGQALIAPQFPNLQRQLEGHDVLCVYGVGDGSFYSQIQSWLKKKEERYAIFVEEDETIFLRAKELPFVKDPKVRLYYHGSEETFAQIAWEFLFLSCTHVNCVEEKNARATQFFYLLDVAMHTVNLLAADSRDMGQRILTNLIHNLSAFPQALLGSSLKDSCRGVPAIICGAGPSLNSIIPLLSKLKDNALLIAGGTAINALNAQGIIPHLAAHVDPHPPYSRFLQQDIAETPFLYQHRFSHELLEKVHGPRVWMAGSGSYPLEEWMNSSCGVASERRDNGWTVATFCTSLALELGCNTLILAGMDFACGEDEAIYASGVSGQEHADEFLSFEDEAGNEHLTKRDWLMSAEWLSAKAKEYSDRRWLNVSSGGLPIKEIPRVDLSSLLFPTSDIDAQLHAVLAQATGSCVDPAQVNMTLAQLKESFRQTSHQVKQLFNLWKKLHPRHPLENTDYVFIQMELEQGICYQHFLQPLWEVWKHPILRKEPHPVGKQLHRLLFFNNVLDTNMRVFA